MKLNAIYEDPIPGGWVVWELVNTKFETQFEGPCVLAATVRILNIIGTDLERPEIERLLWERFGQEEDPEQ